MYQSQKKLNISFNGILTALNEDTHNFEISDLILGEDFVGYIPHKELSYLGYYYDFIGKLVKFEEVKLSDHQDVVGYILTIKLINSDQKQDLFTIPMFVNEANMQISRLKKGMRLCGTFQLLGEIK